MLDPGPMIVDRLVGIDLKLRWAEHHLDLVDSAARQFVEHDLHVAPSHGKFDFNEEWQEILWDGLQATPPWLSLMLGDFAHNARSALDHLIWELVPAAERGNHTHFPILETEKKWDWEVEHRRPDDGKPPTYGLSPEAFALVKTFQPFQPLGRKGKAIAQPLMRLARLSNTDKHRVLHGVVAYIARKPHDLQLVPRGFVAIEKVRFAPPGQILENGAKLADIKVRLIKRPPEGVKVHVQFKAPVHVAFGIDDETIAQLAHLKPILSRCREILAAARALPEVGT